MRIKTPEKRIGQRETASSDCIGLHTSTSLCLGRGMRCILYQEESHFIPYQRHKYALSRKPFLSRYVPLYLPANSRYFLGYP